jgi:hypothetical protein
MLRAGARRGASLKRGGGSFARCWVLVIAAVAFAASVGHAQVIVGAKRAPKVAVSQNKATVPVLLSTAQLSLDQWVLQRFRGAVLLPDSNVRIESLIAHSGAPIVDGSRSGERRDTLVALHFDSVGWKPTVSEGSNVHFVDPSGEISQITGRITARRAFRAPRTANPRTQNAGDWRIGWAYLVALPAKTANAATSGFNGWALVEAPTPNVKRAKN